MEAKAWRWPEEILESTNVDGGALASSSYGVSMNVIVAIPSIMVQILESTDVDGGALTGSSYDASLDVVLSVPSIMVQDHQLGNACHGSSVTWHPVDNRRSYDRMDLWWMIHL